MSTPAPPFRPGGFASLPQALAYAARRPGGIRFFSSLGALAAECSYAQLHERAQDASHRLAALRLPRGGRVALVAQTGVDFLAFFYGCQFTGLLPCPLPYPSGIAGMARYANQLRVLTCAAGASVLLAPRGLLDESQDLGCDVLDYDNLWSSATAEAGTPWGEGDPAYIQYSSGSTHAPKGILVSQRALAANVQAMLRDGLRLREDDRAFSWLPLYHDMGLVGLSIAAMCGQCPVDCIAPSTFARRPALWPQLMAQLGSTITYAPAFGYRLAAQRGASVAAAIDLRALRVAGVGGDMVRIDALDAFEQTFAVSGFRRDAFSPSYGLAEATLAVCMSGEGGPLVDARSTDGLKPRLFVACGEPLPGWELRIEPDRSAAADESPVGRIRVRGDALMDGYMVDGMLQPARDPDGFLDTGDLGYWHHGQLVVTGRSKDLMLVRGRNLWPQDIEWAAETVAGVREGDAAAFAVEPDERPLPDDDAQVVLVLQARTRDAQAVQRLAAEVRAAVQAHAGVAVQVVCVAPGALPFTSSGKLSRAVARQRYLRGDYDAAHAPTPPLSHNPDSENPASP